MASLSGVQRWRVRAEALGAAPGLRPPPLV